MNNTEQGILKGYAIYQRYSEGIIRLVQRNHNKMSPKTILNSFLYHVHMKKISHIMYYSETIFSLC